jgi:hypothetical protein
MSESPEVGLQSAAAAVEQAAAQVAQRFQSQAVHFLAHHNMLKMHEGYH